MLAGSLLRTTDVDVGCWFGCQDLTWICFRFGHQEEDRVLVRDLHNASTDSARLHHMLQY